MHRPKRFTRVEKGEFKMPRTSQSNMVTKKNIELITFQGIEINILVVLKLVLHGLFDVKSYRIQWTGAKICLNVKIWCFVCTQHLNWVRGIQTWQWLTCQLFVFAHNTQKNYIKNHLLEKLHPDLAGGPRWKNLESAKKLTEKFLWGL